MNARFSYLSKYSCAHVAVLSTVAGVRLSRALVVRAAPRRSCLTRLPANRRPPGREERCGSGGRRGSRYRSEEGSYAAAASLPSRSVELSLTDCAAPSCETSCAVRPATARPLMARDAPSARFCTVD